MPKDTRTGPEFVSAGVTAWFPRSGLALGRRIVREATLVRVGQREGEKLS